MGEPRRYRTFVFDSARWDALELRDGDIIVSTPPKCGTTWMQMLCALLVFRTPDLPEPLATLSPWLDMNTRPLDDVVRSLEAQRHRRIIKTHTPLAGLPCSPTVTYVHVARDPRDVALSWDSHTLNVDIDRLVETRLLSVGADDFEELGLTGPPPEPPEDPVERFWLWIESEHDVRAGSCLTDLVHHVTTFWERRDEPNIELFHYSDLRADLAGQMGRLAIALGEDPPTEELIDAATFERMKSRADDLVPNADVALWQDNARFFDRARSGGWRELWGDGDDRRYEAAVSPLATPDLLDWIHHGWLGTAGAPID